MFKLKVTTGKKQAPAVVPAVVPNKVEPTPEVELSPVAAAILRKAVIDVAQQKAVDEFEALLDGREIVSWVDGETTRYGLRSKAKAASSVVELLNSSEDDVDPDLTYALNGFRLTGKTQILAYDALTPLTLEEFAVKGKPFDESAHKRDSAGRFTSTNGSNDSESEDEENEDYSQEEVDELQDEIDDTKAMTAATLDDAWDDEDSMLATSKRDLTANEIVAALNNSSADVGENFSSRMPEAALRKAIIEHLENGGEKSNVIHELHAEAMNDIEMALDSDEYNDAPAHIQDAVEEAADEWVVDKLIEILKPKGKKALKWKKRAVADTKASANDQVKLTRKLRTLIENLSESIRDVDVESAEFAATTAALKQIHANLCPERKIYSYDIPPSATAESSSPEYKVIEEPNAIGYLSALSSASYVYVEAAYHGNLKAEHLAKVNAAIKALCALTK